MDAEITIHLAATFAAFLPDEGKRVVAVMVLGPATALLWWLFVTVSAVQRSLLDE